MTNPNTDLATQRKTKIVATIGPACGSLERLVEMIQAGMNVARLNLSHGTLADHKDQITLLRQASEQLGTSTKLRLIRRIHLRIFLAYAACTASLLGSVAEAEPNVSISATLFISRCSLTLRLCARAFCS